MTAYGFEFFARNRRGSDCQQLAPVNRRLPSPDTGSDGWILTLIKGLRGFDGVVRRGGRAGSLAGCGKVTEQEDVLEMRRTYWYVHPSNKMGFSVVPPATVSTSLSGTVFN